jgi:hypothetical protein
MESNQVISSAIDNIWRFVRGDMLTSDFENWVYSNPTLESLFGEILYLEIISVNFTSKDTVFRLKKTLKEFTVSSTNPSCMCLQLSNI